ncbi:ML domain-containing protein [Gloeopeniophorella convolvens]|nr:ML domain-containing protein [Gloeopeniophorella convolvens]
MARLSLIALLIAPLLSVAHAGVVFTQQDIVNQDTPIHTMEGWSWESCGQFSSVSSPLAPLTYILSQGLSTDAVQIDSIDVFPDPPKPGKNLTVTVKASAQSEIEEGAYVDVVVKLGLIKLLQKQFDLCEEARNAQADVQCPVDKGSYQIEQTVTLPKEIPQAKFKINAHGYTVDDVDLFCVDLNVDFMKRPFLKFW